MLTNANGPHESLTTRLYRAYGAAVSRWATQLCGSSADADDVVQEVFLVAHRRMAAFERPRNPGPWLFRVTANVVRHLWRDRRRRSAISLERAAQIPDAAPNPHEALEHRRGLFRLDRALGSLCDQDQSLLWLCDLRSLPLARVTALTGIKPQTLRVRRFRARVRVARRYREDEQRSIRELGCV